MHHVVLEHWSRRRSWLHARDARAKLIAALAIIIAIATTPGSSYRKAVCYLLVILISILAARLPLLSVLLRAGLVLPFSAAFAAASWFAGDAGRAAGLLWKSYLSALAVLTLVATTPLVQVLRALEWFRVPPILILIAQFLYRYLFIISEQAQHMRMAASCRAGSGRRSFRGAASALSVLFVRSYARADGIQRAMLARGFSGHFPAAQSWLFTPFDLLLGAASFAICLAVRLAV